MKINQFQVNMRQYSRGNFDSQRGHFCHKMKVLIAKHGDTDINDHEVKA